MIEWDWTSTWGRSMDSAPGGVNLVISLFTRNCGNVTMWLYVYARVESWLIAVNRGGRYARSWSYIHESTHNHDNDGKTNYPGCMLYSVNAVHGVCCTWCQLMIMAWRDREGWHIFVCSHDGWVVHEKGRDGGWSWEWCGGYEHKWKSAVRHAIFRWDDLVSV